MQRFSTLLFSIALVALLGALAGCDDSPTSVDDFDIQPDVEVSSTALSLVLTGAESATSFQVSYQGLDSPPEAQGTGVLSLSKASESGSPARGGQQEWEVTASESVQGVVEELITVRSVAGDQEIVDSLSVRVSPFAISSQFTSSFAVVADFEDVQRDSTGFGGTTIQLTNTEVAPNSNGSNALMVNASGSGGVRFERRTSAPNSDRFSFLIKPDPNTGFSLTLTFTEETGGGETEHQIEVPVNAGNQWLRYEIGFAQIGADFNPVATRAGGNGPLVSIEMSADQAVTYFVDQLMLGTADATQVEIEDFERTTLAYGPPFCPPDFQNVNDVAEESDGFAAQSITGAGCFGYNYGVLRPNVQGNDVLSVRAKASSGDSLYVFIEANGQGGFGFDSGTQVGLPVDTWSVVEIPLSSLGDSPSALKDPGISNVGFEARGTDPDFIIDDIKIRSSN